MNCHTCISIWVIFILLTISLPPLLTFLFTDGEILHFQSRHPGITAGVSAWEPTVPFPSAKGG